MVTISTSDIMARQQASLLTNSQNIVKPAAPQLTFLDKVSNFIDKAAPVVYKAQDVVAQVQTRVPGTNLVYNPNLKAATPNTNKQPNYTPLVVTGGLLLTGFLIYKATR